MGLDVMMVVAPVAGALALVYAFIKASAVNKADAGTDKMKEIAGHIREGAMAFLGREYKVLGIFVVIVAVLLAVANASAYGVSTSSSLSSSSLRSAQTVGSSVANSPVQCKYSP